MLKFEKEFGADMCSKAEGCFGSEKGFSDSDDDGEKGGGDDGAAGFENKWDMSV